MAKHFINGSSVKNVGGATKGKVSSSLVEDVENGKAIVVGNVVLNDNKADPAISGRDFNSQRDGQYIVRGFSDKIAGVDDNSAKHGNTADISRSPLESWKNRKIATAIRTNKWNEFTGEWDISYPQVETTQFGIDDAARPTKAIPGEFTYMTGSKVPVNDQYKPKTS